jgi:hypothetical protein
VKLMPMHTVCRVKGRQERLKERGKAIERRGMKCLFSSD